MPFSSVLGASSVIKPGVCTSTTRPSVPYTGQLIYETDTASVASWNGSAWVYTHSSGLVLVKSQTIGSAVSSVTVSDAFSATYDAYKIVITGGGSSAANPALRLTLGATTSGYAMQLVYGTFTNSPLAAGSSAQASWLYAGSGNTTTLSMNVDLLNPFLTEFTFIGGPLMENGSGGAVAGYLNDTTSYTAFTVTPSSGTITGGNIRVYGYKN